MDKGMIKTDFNFGGVGFMEEDELQVIKGSPSHESDSGISSGSSPTYSMTSGIEDQAVLSDFQGPDFHQFEDFDEELSSYLAATQKNETSNSNETSFVYSPVLSTPSPSPVLFTELLSDNHVTCDQLDSSPVLEIPELLEPVLQTRSSERLNKQKQSVFVSKQSTQQSKPSTLKPSQLSVDSEKKEAVQHIQPAQSQLPPVKVIKVISTPSNQSKIETEKQIYEAIDERNRKNAVQAKINREKKKSYIQGLEREIESLKDENSSLKDGKIKMEQTVNVLEEEVQYLKSVLANQSALSNLLKNIPNVNNIRLSSSFSQRKRAANHDHDYQGPVKHQRTTAGVCLHVADDSASLEFCSKCSLMSQIDSEEES